MTTTNALKVTEIAEAIVAALAAVNISLDGNALKVYDHEPRDLDTLPAVTLEGPTTFRRPSAEEPQSQLGSYDWYLSWAVRIYVAFEDPAKAAYDTRYLLAQVFDALDADRSLSGTAEIDSALHEGELGYTETSESEPRRLAIYRCTLDTWSLV